MPTRQSLNASAGKAHAENLRTHENTTPSEAIQLYRSDRAMWRSRYAGHHRLGHVTADETRRIVSIDERQFYVTQK